MTSPLATAAATSSLPSNANTSLSCASAPQMALALDSAPPHLQSESDATNATTKPTNNPITDFMQESDGTNNTKHTPKNLATLPATTTTTPTTTKIPHPQSNQQPAPPYPLSALVQAKNAQQFRRSASLRLRGTKSNLLFNDNGAEHDATDMDMEHANNNNVNTTRIGHNDNAPAITKFAAVAPPTKESQRVASESSSVAGRFSTRRKVVLHSQAAATGLTRSLSLRRQQHLCYPGCKTDSPKETCRAAGGAGAVPADVPADVSAQREQATAAGNCVTTNGQLASDNGAELKKCTKDLQKMSLNLNGAPSTATSAGNGSGSFKCKATTPKTPTTTTAHEHHQHQHQHQHQQPTFNHHHSHATRFIKSSPTTAAPPDTKLTPKTPPVTPDSPCTYLDDDLDSMYSFATTTSGRSTMSCEHPYVARNGTTFSGRKMKYVVHCSNYAGQVGPDYLTPTQRATRQIRRLKEILSLARQDLEQKDSEILRLTREVVELRLFKASLSSPEERSASSDAVTVREAELKTSQDVSPIVDMVDDATKSSPRHIAHAGQHHSQQLSSEMQSSFADSGHFEDLTTSSVHSKDSYAAHTHDIACGSDMAAASGADAAAAAAADVDAEHFKSYELQRQELIRIYELKIEELIRTQDASASEIKRSHNDKVEALLQKLAECNTRYADIVPDYEHAKERIRELEKQLEDLQRKLAEHEEKQNKMYLHMYQKGQEAERIARADQALELAHRAPSNKVSINELLHQLQSTQDELENIRTIYRRLLEAQKNRTHVDPEVTLQFLKSAIYYFLTDKENSQGHLQAIESILEFTEVEKQNISRARTPK